MSPMFLFFGAIERVKFTYTKRYNRNVITELGLDTAPDALDCWAFFKIKSGI